MADGIDLRQGAEAWVHVAHLAVSVLGTIAVVISPTHLSTKFALLASLWIVHLSTMHHVRQTAAEVHRIRVFEDGTASLLTRTGSVPALIKGGAWTSRWLSVVPLQPLNGRNTVRCTVCRSANPADCYRRLQVLLRHRVGQEPSARWGRL